MLVPWKMSCCSFSPGICGRVILLTVPGGVKTRRSGLDNTSALLPTAHPVKISHSHPTAACMPHNASAACLWRIQIGTANRQAGAKAVRAEPRLCLKCLLTSGRSQETCDPDGATINAASDGERPCTLSTADSYTSGCWACTRCLCRGGSCWLAQAEVGAVAEEGAQLHVEPKATGRTAETGQIRLSSYCQ